MEKIIRFIKSEEGVTAPEYALILALIAGFIIGAVTLMGGAVSDTFTNVAGQMPAGAP
jgi:pilus assembly protein Flp/PilA